MATARAYTATSGFTRDFFAVRDFLRRINADEVATPSFLWARWEWAHCLPYLDRTALGRIGVWESDGRVVALATYESSLGEAYLVVDPAHRELLPEVVDHALANLRHADGRLAILVPHGDTELASLVAARGCEPAGVSEPNMRIDLASLADVSAPDGYRLSSMADESDLWKLDRCLHSGFDHPGEAPSTDEDIHWRWVSTSAPGLDRSLCITAVAPDGEYAAYAGMWHAPGTDYALVEPVCTQREHRRRGCGRAAVLEGLRRCRERGARWGYVGSDQEFYAALGFVPIPGDVWWRAPAT